MSISNPSVSAKHTPGPWKWDEPSNWHGLDARIFVGEPYGIVAQVPIEAWRPKSIGRANAAFIVQACNSHEQLVEALRLCSKVLCSLPPITWADVLNNLRLLELLGLNPYAINEGLANGDTPIYLGSCGVVAKAEAALQKAGVR